MKRSSSIFMGLVLGVTLLLSAKSVAFATAADHVDFTVDGVDYVVSERYTEEQMPAGFERETVEIGGHTYSEPVKDGIRLLYLKPAADTSGSGEFYLYNESAGSVEKFYFLGDASYYVIPKEGDASHFTQLTETTITVDDNTIPVYQLVDSNNDFYYVYGVDSTGEEEWYSYRESTGQVAKADTYALFLTSQAAEGGSEEGEAEAEAEEEKESVFSKLSGENTRNILVVVVIVVAIIIIFFINLRVFRHSDDDDDIWAEPEEDEDEKPVSKKASEKARVKRPVAEPEEDEDEKPAPAKAATAAVKQFSTRPAAPAESTPEEEVELPTEEAILKNAMAGIMDEPAPKKVTSAIDSLPKKTNSNKTGDDEITMIDLNNL